MAQIPPLNNHCCVNNGGAPALSVPKSQQAGPSHPDTSALAMPWEQGSGREPLLPDSTLLRLTCLSLELLGPRLSAQWEMHCTLDHGLDDCRCRSQDVFISLPCLVTIMKAVALAGLSYTRERRVFILPMWFLLSCLSWSARPSYPFWGALITKAPSILPLRSVDRGRKSSCLGKLSSYCQPEWRRWCGRHQRGEGPYGPPYLFCPSQ